MAWFDEYEETFEYVKSEPMLSFLPMEVKFNFHISDDYRFSFTATSAYFFLPEPIRFNGNFLWIL